MKDKLYKYLIGLLLLNIWSSIQGIRSWVYYSMIILLCVSIFIEDIEDWLSDRYLLASIKQRIDEAPKFNIWVSYTVKNGDTLYSIAQQHYGMGAFWRKIADDNNITDPDSIHEGQTLKIYKIIIKIK